MEQIKLALSWLKTHHFWVLAVLVLGVAAGAWYTGSTGLAAKFETNKRKIDSEFSTQTSLRSKPFKPNDKINELQQKEIEELATGVRRIWQNLYGRQEEEVLIWPKELGSAFADHMRGKQFGDAIRGDMRDRYLNYIQKRFPELVKIADARELDESGGSLGGRSRRGPIGGDVGARLGRPGAGESEQEPEETHLVEWLDQDLLRQRMILDKRPSALEIWVLQEDLWVYETLLKQIADTNKASGATRRNRAPVRTITEMQVGRPAAGAGVTGGRLFVPEEGGPALGGAGGMGRGMMGEGMGMRRGMMSPGMGRTPGGGMGRGGFDTGGPAGGDEAAILMAGRYVDDTGQPIETVPPDYKIGTEFKQLPLRMVLEMDQRWLTRLIVELADAPLQVEIQQVRVNPSEDASASTGRTSNRGGDVAAFDREPSVGTVVLHGVIYIFNPPDAASLTVTDGV